MEHLGEENDHKRESGKVEASSKSRHQASLVIIDSFSAGIIISQIQNQRKGSFAGKRGKCAYVFPLTETMNIRGKEWQHLNIKQASAIIL